MTLFRALIFTLATLLALAGPAFPAFAQGGFGKTDQALFNSVRNNDLEGVRGAIIAGADVFATDFQGNRAADVAVDLGLFDIAHYILSVMDRKRVNRTDRPTPQPAPQTAFQTPQDPAPIKAPIEPPIEPPVQTPDAAPTLVSVPPEKAPPGGEPEISLGPNPFAVARPTDPAEETLGGTSPDERDPHYKAPPELHVEPVSTPEPESAPESVLSSATPEPAQKRAQEAPQKPVVEQASKTRPKPAPAPEDASKAELAALSAVLPIAPPAAPPAEPVVTPVRTPSRSAPHVFQPQGKAQSGVVERLFDRVTQIFSAGNETPKDETSKDGAPAAPQTASVVLPLPATQESDGQQSAPSETRAAPTMTRHRDIRLTSTFGLGKALPPKPAAQGVAAAPIGRDKAIWPCVEKGRRGTVCLETAPWPQPLQPYLGDHKNHLYRGDKVVVAYEEGRADVFYAVFAQDRFEDVVGVFSDRLGPPDAVTQRAVKPFQEARVANPVRVWFGFDEQAGREIKLEIARYDDRRGTFPVMSDGVVLLSYVGEDSIFRYTAPVELQVLN